LVVYCVCSCWAICLLYFNIFFHIVCKFSFCVFVLIGHWPRGHVVCCVSRFRCIRIELIVLYPFPHHGHFVVILELMCLYGRFLAMYRISGVISLFVIFAVLFCTFPCSLFCLLYMMYFLPEIVLLFIFCMLLVAYFVLCFVLIVLACYDSRLFLSLLGIFFYFFIFGFHSSFFPFVFIFWKCLHSCCIAFCWFCGSYFYCMFCRSICCLHCCILCGSGRVFRFISVFLFLVLFFFCQFYLLLVYLVKCFCFLYDSGNFDVFGIPLLF